MRCDVCGRTIFHGLAGLIWHYQHRHPSARISGPRTASTVGALIRPCMRGTNDEQR